MAAGRSFPITNMDWTAFNNTITGLGGTAANVLKAVNGGGSAAPATTATATPTNSTGNSLLNTKTLLIAGGILAAIVAVWLVVRGK